VEYEKARAVEAMSILDKWFKQKTGDNNKLVVIGRRLAAAEIGVSVDTLRNWERNGLFSVTRNDQNQLAFSEWDMEKIRVIRLLRNCGYTISSLLRVFGDEEKLSEKPSLLLSLPNNDADFFYVTDLFLDYLDEHSERAKRIMDFIRGKS